MLLSDRYCLTCDVDLDLQETVLGNWHRGPLGDHATLDRLWHDQRGGGAGAGCAGARVSAGVTGPALTGLGAARRFLHRNPQEVLHQLEPVENEKDPQVVEDHREAGGVTCGSAEGGTQLYSPTPPKISPRLETFH